MQLPKRLAHRGASAIAPENTLAALQLAAELGATWVEFDVSLSADDVAVVIHDNTVDRTTDGAGRVRRLRLKQLRYLDAGSWFAPHFAGEKIPTLDEWLELSAQLGLSLNIECKVASEADAGTLVNAVKRCLTRSNYFSGRVLMSSGNVCCVKACCELMHDKPRAVIAERLTTGLLKQARSLDCLSINLNHKKISAADVQLIRKSGFGCLLFTANDAQRIYHLYTLGVDGVFSDVVSHPS